MVLQSHNDQFDHQTALDRGWRDKNYITHIFYSAWIKASSSSSLELSEVNPQCCGSTVNVVLVRAGSSKTIKGLTSV